MLQRPILRVGLTGNIAAGKSTVSGWLAELGCYVINLDKIGHECLQPGERPHEEVIRAFGEDVATAEGTIDRRRLGALVFADPAARARLEEILHPLIRRREMEDVAAWASNVETGIAVTEAALLYETRATGWYHRIVVVVAPKTVREGRLAAAGLSPDEARQRMESQLAQEEKARLADYVVDNSGDLDATRSQVDSLYERLTDDLLALGDGSPLPPILEI